MPANPTDVDAESVVGQPEANQTEPFPVSDQTPSSVVPAKRRGVAYVKPSKKARSNEPASSAGEERLEAGKGKLLGFHSPFKINYHSSLSLFILLHFGAFTNFYSAPSEAERHGYIQNRYLGICSRRRPRSREDDESGRRDKGYLRRIFSQAG